MTLPLGITGSLKPTFVSVRPVSLTVKHPYAFALDSWCPTNLRVPSHASVTLSEATAPVKLPAWQCPCVCTTPRLDSQHIKGGISRMTPHILAYMLHCLPPILHIIYQISLPSYSKGSRGLFVPLRLSCIFTAAAISLSLRLRQCPDRYAIRAGQNLPDKEFRYLRTVIVTAAVYWGFNSMLAHLLLTFQHRAGVTPYTSSCELAECYVFDKQSPGPLICDPLRLQELVPSPTAGIPYPEVTVLICRVP